MMIPNEPCSWPVAVPGEGACKPCDALAGLDDTVRASVEAMAVGLLWRWTGRRFGVCEVSVRPCRAECASRPSTYYGRSGGLPGAGWLPVVIGGEWYNVGCGSCVGSCTCAVDQSRALHLPGPVAEVSEIIIEGTVLPPSAYTVRDDVLYRVDGGVWPACNDELGDPGEPDSGAWSVTYERGIPVPLGGDIAAYQLSCQIAMALCEDDDCGLPDNVRSVTRQGVSVELVSTEFRDTKDGATGIWMIDSWVASNVQPVFSPPRVFSPDVRRGAGRGTYGGLGRGRTR